MDYSGENSMNEAILPQYSEGNSDRKNNAARSSRIPCATLKLLAIPCTAGLILVGVALIKGCV